MAFNTQQKRQSALGVGRPYMRGHFAGVKDWGWRLAAGSVYSGNTLVADPTPFNTPQKRQTTLGVGRPYMRGHFAGTNNIFYRGAVGNIYPENLAPFIFTGAPRWGHGEYVKLWAGERDSISWAGQKRDKKWN